MFKLIEVLKGTEMNLLVWVFSLKMRRLLSRVDHTAHVVFMLGKSDENISVPFTVTG